MLFCIELFIQDCRIHPVCVRYFDAILRWNACNRIEHHASKPSPQAADAWRGAWGEAARTVRPSVTAEKTVLSRRVSGPLTGKFI